MSTFAFIASVNTFWADFRIGVQLVFESRYKYRYVCEVKYSKVK